MKKPLTFTGWIVTDKAAFVQQVNEVFADVGAQQFKTEQISTGRRTA